MKHYHYFTVGGVLLLVVALALLAFPAVAQEETPNPLGDPPTFLRGIYDAWAASPHADVTAEAFNHWNEDDPKEVSASCAKCHSTPGYQDYLGADGSEFGSIDNTIPVGTVINCDACHNSVAIDLRAVTFPSGVELGNLGDSARCMVCHQGREFGGSIDAAVENAGLTDSLDTVSADLRFINIHYFAAAATRYGSEVHGGYEYAGMRYQPRFDHVEGYQGCIDCHNPHTLELKVDECTACHEGVDSLEAVADIRMNGSLTDYDGDGNIEEGIKAEIEGMQAKLYEAMQTYASEVAGLALIYNPDAYPYVFGDANGNGTIDEGEGSYNAFTPRLLKAAYNYQVSVKDPGAFAHNAKYIIALLYDSTMDLNTAISAQVDLSTAHRNDPGHFDATGEPFRHWDADGEVSASCVKCHTAEGLPFFLENGVTIAMEPANGLACSTCHSEIGGEWARLMVNEVTFPSGLVASFGEGDDANLCINCHQGRESTASVNAAITRSGAGPDDVSDAISFRNVHYFAAGATWFGDLAQGMYQYAGMEYNGENVHVRKANTCTECHDVHSLEVRVEDLCTDCHEDIEDSLDVHMIRMEEDEDVEGIDYNGNGDATEPIYQEVKSFADALLVAVQDYAANTVGTPIVYSPSAYPYFFADVNGNGEWDADDARYTTWTPRLLEAAYNYQYFQKDPGAFAHNPDYVMQVLYDSLADIGGADAVASFTRPPVLKDE
ncbi:MAG: cytochrome c3 family protein [Anaerolineaceae bacterium]|nr:cytochrome c3 family protein [Anaerolineaceae bacterium]